MGAPAARGPALPTNASTAFVAQLIAMKHWDTIGSSETGKCLGKPSAEEESIKKSRRDLRHHGAKGG